MDDQEPQKFDLPIQHYGVKGMRWGVQRELDSDGNPLSNFEKLRKARDGGATLKARHLPGYAKVVAEHLPLKTKLLMAKVGVTAVAIPLITKYGPTAIRLGSAAVKNVWSSGLLAKPFKALANSVVAYNGKLIADRLLNSNDS